jgi:hypothetical protein
MRRACRRRHREAVMSALTTSVKLGIGDWSIDLEADARTELLALETIAAIDRPIDACRVTLYAQPPVGGGDEGVAGALTSTVGAAASMLGDGSGASAASVEVRGKSLKHGDSVTVELAAGDVSGRVMTAELQAIGLGLETLTLVGRTGYQRLAATRIDQVYENQTLGQIVRDLCSQAGVQAGQIDTGAKYPYLVVHESRPILRTIRELARREGLDVWFDADNKLNVQRFSRPKADHTFRYGKEILDLWTRHDEPPLKRVVVYGESPASQNGTDTWHWLVRDLAPFRGEDGQGSPSLAQPDAVVRTRDAAVNAAKGRRAAVIEHAVWGRLKVLGAPTLLLGQAVAVADTPKPSLDGTFKVQRIQHVVSKTDGFVTFVDIGAVPGAGGAGAAGAASQLAGGLLS